MQERIFNLLEMCLQAKKKGHDAFFEYLAHVNIVKIRVYKNGWKSKEIGEPNPPTVEFQIYTNNSNCSKNLTELRNAEEYIKGLIDNVCPR